MGEHEGREESSGQSERGALPEGAALVGEPDPDPADSAQRDSVPPLRAQYSRPDDLGPESLDLLASCNEPELLMLALRKLAASRPGKFWAIVGQHAGFAAQSLKHANEPPPRTAES